MISLRGDADANEHGRIPMQLYCNNALCIPIMNIFFHHRGVHHYTLCRNSLGQRSLINFCIASTHLVQLLVCNLHLGKPPERAYTNMEGQEILPKKMEVMAEKVA